MTPAPKCERMPGGLAGDPWLQVGSVRGLYSRASAEPDARRMTELQTIAGHGVVGDRHASPFSPRQLLIAGQAAYRHLDLPEAALRENLLVDFPTDRLRSGDLLRVGRDVVLWLTFQCEPCSLLERRCPGTLKTIGRQRGMLARVVRGGVVRDDDTIWQSHSSIAPMSDDWHERVARVARAVPPGRYIVYRQLAQFAGVANAYCRAFPRVLAKLPADVGARVRSGATLSSHQPWDGAELFDVDDHFS